MHKRPSRAGVVMHMKVDDDQAGQRIDNFLACRLKGVPRSHVYRILRSGEVRVNKGRVKPNYRLAVDDEIRVPPVRTGASSVATASDLLQTRLEAAVLLEDEDLLVLNKPAGLAVHGGSGLPFGVIEVLRQARPHAPVLELVHRLDRGTSGCLLIAKSRRALIALHALLRTADVDKHYVALLAGGWPGGARTVTAPVGRRADQPGVSVSENGKQAHSVFKPLKRFEPSTLVEVSIATGRMHQIRLHAAHIGHAVAGDTKYGDHAFNHLMRKRGLRRLFLHAARLSFQMPESGRRYAVIAPLEASLQQVLDDLSEKGTW